MKVYENIVIGAFLFDLGRRLGSKNPDFVCANLLQQSPWDTPLADVLLASASICRIVEFKRSASKDPKERDKHGLLVRWINHSEENRTWLPISRKIHWYVEIDDVADEESSFDTRVVPYYDLDMVDGYIDLPAFLDLTVEQITREPLPRNQLVKYREYMECLMVINEKTGAAPGALVLTSIKNGQLRWLATDDLGDMFLTRRNYELKLERALERGRETPGYGMSL